MKKKFLHLCLVVLITSAVGTSPVAAEEWWCQTLYDKCAALAKEGKDGCQVYKDFDATLILADAFRYEISNLCHSKGCAEAAGKSVNHWITAMFPSLYCHGGVQTEGTPYTPEQVNN